MSLLHVEDGGGAKADNACRRRWIVVGTEEEVRMAAAVPGVSRFVLALLGERLTDPLERRSRS